LIASTTCLAVEVTAPLPSVARETETSLPVTATLSGWLAAPGLSSSVCTSLLFCWP